LLDSGESDRVADEEIFLHLIGEMGARDDLVGGDGAHFLHEKLAHPKAFRIGLTGQPRGNRDPMSSLPSSVTMSLSPV
jgi:hypothetical protein